jgi:hypothetical protein
MEVMSHFKVDGCFGGFVVSFQAIATVRQTVRQTTLTNNITN